MQPAVILTAVTIILAISTVSWVLSRRERRDTHWLICGLMVALVVWTASMCVRHIPAAAGLEEPAFFGWFLGVAVMPPLWLTIAFRLTQTPRPLTGHASTIALGAPPLLGLIALVTNDYHGLMVNDRSIEALRQGASHYAGPLFWVQLAWSYGVTLVGSVLYLRAARQMTGRGEWSRGLAVALAAVLPLLASVPRALGWMPTGYSLTPIACSISTLLLLLVYWRHHLHELTPVARQDVIEHLSDGVVVTDPDGRIVDLNPAAVALIGQPEERLRGNWIVRVLADFAADLDESEVDRTAREAAQAGGTGFTRLRLRDGRYFEITSSAVRGRDETIAGYYAVFRDRTEQRHLERFLQQSQRLETVAGLAAGLAHEVNNPLSFVRANLNHVQALAEGVREAEAPKPGELDELGLVVEECVDGVDRIARIIDGMRRFSHLDSGEPEAVDANLVVDDALRLALLHETGRVEIETRLEEALPSVRGSAENLVQAVLNLLVNGKQALAAHEAARIHVRTLAADPGVVIEVSDNGPGVPDELRERIFDPFFTTKGPGEGSGLGLAITAEIARKHGGALELDENADGGATFRLRLPALEPPG